MESDMVSDFENATFLNSDEALRLIHEFFEVEFPEFIIQDEVDGGIYFMIRYVWKEIDIMLGAGRGRIEYSFKIDGKEFPLRQLDNRMDEIVAASGKNFLFVLNLIKSFLKK